MAVPRAESSADGQVLVRFFTKLPADLRVPDNEVAVPASLKRYGLSQIINHLLGLDPPRPFDFLIDGELLRKTLGQHLLDHGISPESLLRVEYVPAVVPPEPARALPHDDWVSALAGCAASGRLVSGAYDGGLKVWDRAGALVASVAAHVGGVTAAVWLQSPPLQQQAEGAPAPVLISAGKDAAVRLWQATPDAKLGKAAASGRKQQAAAAAAGFSLKQVAVCLGHSDAVAALAVDASGATAASGGWDGKLLLWSATGVDASADPATMDGDGGDDEPPAAAVAEAQQGKKKRQRVGAGTAGSAAAAAAPVAEQQPLGSLEGHVHCVSALCYARGGGGGGRLVSGGWDHSVRVWDVAAGRCASTYNGSKAVFAVASAPALSGGSSGLIAFAGAEAAVRIWDTRAQGESLSVKGYATPGGSGWVTALAWRPLEDDGNGNGSSGGGEYHVASASHDGTVRLWDLRTPVPLATLTQHTDKALALSWWGSHTLASGGADCKVQLYDLPA